MKSRKRTKTTEITIEKRESFVIRKPRKLVLAWCPECGEQMPMLTPEEAAMVLSVSTRTIYRWVESRKLHFTETPEGFLLVCRNLLS